MELRLLEIQHLNFCMSNKEARIQQKNLPSESLAITGHFAYNLRSLHQLGVEQRGVWGPWCLCKFQELTFAAQQRRGRKIQREISSFDRRSAGVNAFTTPWPLRGSRLPRALWWTQLQRGSSSERSRPNGSLQSRIYDQVAY